MIFRRCRMREMGGDGQFITLWAANEMAKVGAIVQLEDRPASRYEVVEVLEDAIAGKSAVLEYRGEPALGICHSIPSE